VREVLAVQNDESPNPGSFGERESRDKKAFGCSLRGEVQSILYGGRWWLPLSPGRGEFCESKVAHGLS
jgi:hypothetical protein